MLIGLDAVASLETASCGENGLRQGQAIRGPVVALGARRAAVSKSPSRDRPDGDGRDGRVRALVDLGNPVAVS